jgi:hypothetical protein
MTETTQEIVYACEEPALIIAYDRELSTHSIWTYRQTKAEVDLLSPLDTKLTCAWEIDWELCVIVESEIRLFGIGSQRR